MCGLRERAARLVRGIRAACLLDEEEQGPSHHPVHSTHTPSRLFLFQGDSGGPLMVERDDGHWVLVGTVSHGIKCAAPYLPGVYMRTTFYKPWLHSITGVS